MTLNLDGSVEACICPVINLDVGLLDRQIKTLCKFIMKAKGQDDEDLQGIYNILTDLWDEIPKNIRDQLETSLANSPE